MSLSNKTAIVTGAASGIGREIARQLAREGASVAIADLDLEAARAAAAELDATGASTLAIHMDVTDEAQVDAGVDAVCRRFGGVDILVSNAGIQIVAPVDQFDLGDWKKMLAIHLDGAFLTTRACLRRMYAGGRGGTILYVGSVHSKEASKLKAPYVTAKHGLIGPREDRSPGKAPNMASVRTSSVPDLSAPRSSRSRFRTGEGVWHQRGGRCPTIMLEGDGDGRIHDARHVARCAVFLASFPSNALTGQSIVVSHGWSMQ